MFNGQLASKPWDECEGACKYSGKVSIMLNCRPNGRRRLGRPLKMLLDKVATGL